MLKPEMFSIEKIYVPVKKRKGLNLAVVKEVAESILEVGQQDPILVRSDQDRFVLVEGLHRLEACKALGEGTILAVLVSARPTSQNSPSPLDTAIEAERQKMERLRKLRLEKEAAEKTKSSVVLTEAPPLVERTKVKGKGSRAGGATSDSRPANLAAWIASRERDGFRF